MKTKLPMGLVAIAVLAALLAVPGSLVRAQQVATIALPAPGGTVQLYPWCNNVALTFPDGTPSETVVQAVTPSETVQAMWRHNAALNMFEGFSPAAPPEANDLLTVNFLDPVWLCLAGTPTPAPTAAPPPPPAPGAPTATPVPPTAAPTATPVPPTPPTITPLAYVAGRPMLIAADGQYLGVVSCRSYDTDGIFNKYGMYGSKYSTTSIWNSRFGR